MQKTSQQIAEAVLEKCANQEAANAAYDDVVNAQGMEARDRMDNFVDYPHIQGEDPRAALMQEAQQRDAGGFLRKATTQQQDRVNALSPEEIQVLLQAQQSGLIG